MQPAISAYQRVLSLEPGFTWAHNELGEAYLEEARRAIARGQEPASLLEKAVHQYEQALALDPGFALPVGGLLETAKVRLEAEIARGREAPAAHQALAHALARLEQTGSSPSVVSLWKARAHRLRAHHDFVLGRDPRPSLEAAVEVIRVIAGDSPEDFWLLEELVLDRLLEAENKRRLGRNPALALEKARAALRKVSEVNAMRAKLTCKAVTQQSPLLAPECQRLSNEPQNSIR
jgi:serine/threonine-protein kinase